MSSSSDYHKFLEAFAGAHVIDGSMEKDGDGMLGFFMNMQGSARLALAEVRELKDRGNDLFRKNDFDMAAACYDEACNLLSLSLRNIEGEDIQSLSSLAVSLISNMAACALKLEEYRAAAGMCSMILNTFPRNAKALFRRAVAYMKLKRFPLAEKDLVEALVVEPNNKDVLRELDVVKGHRLIKDNGKRVLEVGTQDDMVGTNKRHVHIMTSDVDTKDNTKDSESVIIEVMDDHSEADIKENESGIKENESVDTEMREAHNICTNMSTFEFSKRGNGSSRLRIPAQSYKQLLDGKEVCFFRKHDLSTLTIRAIQVKVTSERDSKSEQCRKKKRRRRRRKWNSKMVGAMNKDMPVMTPSASINEKPAFSSRNAPSEAGTLNTVPTICDSLSLPGTHIPQDSTRGVANGPIAPLLVVHEKATSISSSSSLAQKDSNDQQPFFFSATPKKCKIYSAICCRYPSHKKWRMTTSKKKHSYEDESPRRILSTSSKSRPFSRKFLRPRGVSVSSCRYSSEAKSIRKRKELFGQPANSDRPIKKPNLVVNSVCSLFAYHNNVVTSLMPLHLGL